MIDDFRGEYRWLSNYAYSSVVLDGVTYPTIEHAYQAAKNTSALYRAEILRHSSPRDARLAGRTCKLRNDWEQVKVDVMRDLIAQKFAPGGRLADRLIATGDHELVEGNTWGDTFWGVCNGVGENMLGKLLMAQRQALVEMRVAQPMTCKELDDIRVRLDGGSAWTSVDVARLLATIDDLKEARDVLLE